MDATLRGIVIEVNFDPKNVYLSITVNAESSAKVTEVRVEISAKQSDFIVCTERGISTLTSFVPEKAPIPIVVRKSPVEKVTVERELS